MPNYEIVPATKAHIDFIAPIMRQADVNEIWASNRQRPKEGLVLSVLASRDPKAGLVDGIPICMFGVAVPSLIGSDVGHPWLLATDELPKHAKPFLRRSKSYIEEQKRCYNTLFNYVDARNTLAVKWIRWLGFSLQKAVPLGPDKVPFHPFEWARNQ